MLSPPSYKHEGMLSLDKFLATLTAFQRLKLLPLAACLTLLDILSAKNVFISLLRVLIKIDYFYISIKTLGLLHKIYNQPASEASRGVY